MPLHGPASSVGGDSVNAIKLALDESRGTAGLFTINYVSLDDATSRAQTWTEDKVLDGARQAIEDSGAIAYIGDLHSGATALALPALNEVGILQVSPASTYVGLTREGGAPSEPERFYPSGRRTFARLVPADHIQAAAQVGYMGERDVRRLAVLHDGSLYGRSLAEQVRTAAEGDGIEVAGLSRVGRADGDAAVAAEEVAALAPDGMFFAGTVDADAADILDAVHDASPQADLFAPDGVATTAFTRQLSDAAAQRTFVTSPNLGGGVLPPAARRFAKRFRATFGKAPEPQAIFAYEAMKAVLAAVERAGPRGDDRQAVVDQFLSMDRRGTVLGDYSIDRNGDISTTDYGGYRVRGEELVFDSLLRVAR
ncbi:MAG TPA: branched-chain amino acid ABC transporter substrate-binding protein [Solirubrobacteraceae bacterium]|nr:branched-chain amino acid ABC transporter substrate-binding protein [Solirubrobacteraceae bacterium]